MRERDRSFHDELANLEVPPHRPGFWDGVEAGLDRVDFEDRPAPVDDGIEVVPLGDVRKRRRRPSPWAVASAAAAVVLVLGAATAFLVLPEHGGDTAANDAPVVAGVLDDDVESLSGAASTTQLEVARPASPWGSGELPQASVPEALVTEWQNAENQQWCALIAPGSVGAAGESAVPRAAEFGGGWAVAWDLPDGPGQTADGADCENCGRSAFGVAGVGLTPRAETGTRQPHTIVWADGSRADWGGEGFDASAQKRLAEIVIDGQGCIYQVWSNLGDEHLEGLIESLRFVEGMSAGTVTLRTPGDNPQTTVLGVPPWDGEPLARNDVDALVFAQRRALNTDAPELMLAALGGGMDDATIRDWGGGVAWDRPDGPGHTSNDEPCGDCGRGVVGVGWQETVAPAVDRVRPPYRLEWSDGSYAEYGGRQADPALPRDRTRFLDPETEAWAQDALLATIHVNGMEGEVVVWTHLGETHLLELINQLRFVGP